MVNVFGRLDYMNDNPQIGQNWIGENGYLKNIVIRDF